MRVIGGKYRSRLLKTLPGLRVRPTPDRLRETLFNILTPHIEGTTFLDAYAGSGAVGIEALSRGAARVIFFETDLQALRVIRGNLSALDISGGAVRLVRGRATRLYEEYPADIVFVDPPYNVVGQFTESLERLGALAPSLVVVQHDSHLELGASYGCLEQRRTVKQGSNRLTFFGLSELTGKRPAIDN